MNFRQCLHRRKDLRKDRYPCRFGPTPGVLWVVVLVVRSLVVSIAQLWQRARLRSRHCFFILLETYGAYNMETTVVMNNNFYSAGYSS